MSSKCYDLFNANGEHCDEVTPSLLQKLGFEDYTIDGEFSPLSQREVDLHCYGEGVHLQSGFWIRYIRSCLIDGKKYFNISDDDHDFEGLRSSKIIQNLNQGQPLFEKMAAAFGVELEVRIDRHEDGSIKEYWLDMYVPFERFSGLNTAEQMTAFFKQCNFTDSVDIEQTLLDVANDELDLDKELPITVTVTSESFLTYNGKVSLNTLIDSGYLKADETTDQLSVQSALNQYAKSLDGGEFQSNDTATWEIDSAQFV